MSNKNAESNNNIIDDKNDTMVLQNSQSDPTGQDDESNPISAQDSPVAEGGSLGGAHSHRISDVADLQSELDEKIGSVSWGDIAGNLNDQTDINAALDQFSKTGHQHAISDVGELQTALDDKASAAHGHAIDDVAGLQSKLDDKAAASHSHTIGAITNLQSKLDDKAAASHSHTIGAITNLQSKLDDKAAASHSHTIDEITNLQSKLDDKAAVTHSHTIGEIINLQSKLDDKAAVTHSHTIGEIINLQAGLDGKADGAPSTAETYYAMYEGSWTSFDPSGSGSGGSGSGGSGPGGSVSFEALKRSISSGKAVTANNAGASVSWDAIEFDSSNSNITTPTATEFRAVKSGTYLFSASGSIAGYGNRRPRAAPAVCVMVDGVIVDRIGTLYLREIGSSQHDGFAGCVFLDLEANQDVSLGLTSDNGDAIDPDGSITFLPGCKATLARLSAHSGGVNGAASFGDLTGVPADNPALASSLAQKADKVHNQPLSTISDAGDLAAVDFPANDGKKYAINNTGLVEVKDGDVSANVGWRDMSSNEFVEDNYSISGSDFGKVIILPPNLIGKTIKYLGHSAYSELSSSDRAPFSGIGALIGFELAENVGVTIQTVSTGRVYANGENYGGSFTIEPKPTRQYFTAQLRGDWVILR